MSVGAGLLSAIIVLQMDNTFWPFDETAFARSPLLYDAYVSVVLAPWDRMSHELFTAIVRWSYQTVPESPVMRFAATSSSSAYRKLLDDPACAIVWHFRPIGKLVEASSSVAFQLQEFTVNGQFLPSKRSVHGKSQVTTVDMGQEVVTAQRPVTISYTYQTLIRQYGHLLHIDISQPTHGLDVTFSYKDCGIESLNVLDYIAGPKRPTIKQTADLIELKHDGWVVPKGGVAFVWALDDNRRVP